LSVLRAQIFCFLKIGNRVFSAPFRLDKRGVRVVTNAGWDAVDAFGDARRAALEADGQAVWSWRSEAGAKAAESFADDGGSQAMVTGESAEYAVKTIAQGR
jgi:hypothetical protein